ncbi:hypothetical protein Tsubulata_009322 [Turnera subulata]|uniref:Uncharacterized protein n=1 Tax=Turnera subulata TaxID=218843 RepID=A0A9Q0F436_9ROSI|nr:hypothetical protein Tsubulata_009322 [Turnera subulata]
MNLTEKNKQMIIFMDTVKQLMPKFVLMEIVVGLSRAILMSFVGDHHTIELVGSIDLEIQNIHMRIKKKQMIIFMDTVKHLMPMFVLMENAPSGSSGLRTSPSLNVCFSDRCLPKYCNVIA